MVKAFEALNPTAIDVKMEGYVVLAGILVSTAILMTTIVIIVALLFILLIEVYRRRHVRPQKSAKQ
jgi:heme/copper-type cytochrome/quinol oxidase subunit 2